MFLNGIAKQDKAKSPYIWPFGPAAIVASHPAGSVQGGGSLGASGRHHMNP